MIPPTDTTATASSGRRWSACLAAACLAGLLLVPTDASGADLEPGAGGCSDPLVSYSPAGQHGDVLAVAIVAQSVEQGVPGWAHVAWQATPDTTVTAVSVVSGGIATSLTGALSSGVADAVERIDFCGTTTPESAAAGSAPAPATPAGAGADPSDPTGDPPVEQPAEGADGPAPADPAPQPDAIEAGETPAGSRAIPGDAASGPDGPGDTEAATADDGVAPDLDTEAPVSPPGAPRTPQPNDALTAVDVVLASSGTDALSADLSQTRPDPAAVPRGVAIGLTAGALVLLSTRRRDEGAA